IIPEWARIDPALCFLDQHRYRPIARWIFRPGHVNATIRIAVIYIKFAPVIPDRRSPDTLAMLRTHENVLRFKFPNGVIDDLPVDEGFGMKDRKSGYRIKARRGHIKIVTDANNVRVRIVRVNYRVFVCTVAIVGDPGF